MYFNSSKQPSIVFSVFFQNKIAANIIDKQTAAYNQNNLLPMLPNYIINDPIIANTGFILEFHTPVISPLFPS